MIGDEMQWTRFEDMVLTALQNAFSQSDVDALIAFYRSDPGRAVLAQLPLGLQAFTAERSAEFDAIYKSQGATAAAARIKKVMGVTFKPSEIEGVCEFFTSPTGKHISAQKPKVMSQLEAGAADMDKETEDRMQAMAAEYESRMHAAADASPTTVTGN